MAKRFGQGLEVDRDRPHIFHRDYWALRVLRQGVRDFVWAHENELRGQTVLDFGAGNSPYHQPFEAARIQLLRADVNPSDPSVLAIDGGRVPLADGAVA